MQVTDYFALLGFERYFNIDYDQLEKRYFELQRQFHPDRVIGKSSSERLAALNKSTDINAAYEALKQPLKRAEHLLKLNGVSVNEENGSVKPSQELLMEMLELQERLSEAANPGEISSYTKMAEQETEKSIRGLIKAFEEDKLDEAAQLTIRLKYLTKFFDEIKIRKIALGA